MLVWLNSIRTGLEIYLILAIPMAVVYGVVSCATYGKIKITRFLITQAFIAYMSCVFALVFLPFPESMGAMKAGYEAQLIPFYFIADIIKNPVPAAVLVVVFNIVMTIPFGMFLRYYTECSFKKTVLYGLMLSLFIETVQFTGVFFLLPGSFRLFDVDDLICNALGAGLGYLIFEVLTENVYRGKVRLLETLGQPKVRREYV